MKSKKVYNRPTIAITECECTNLIANSMEISSKGVSEIEDFEAQTNERAWDNLW